MTFQSTQTIDSLRTPQGARTFARAIGGHIASALPKEDALKEVTSCYSQYVKSSRLKPAIDAGPFNQAVREGIEEHHERKAMMANWKH
jgi:hypothetical protein